MALLSTPSWGGTEVSVLRSSDGAWAFIAVPIATQETYEETQEAYDEMSHLHRSLVR